MTDSETIRSHSHRVSQTVAILVLLTCLLMPDMASAYKGHYHGGHHYGYLALGLGIAHLAYRGHGGRHRYHHYSYYPYGHQYGHSRPYRNYPYDRNYYRYRPRLSNAVEADYGRTQASVVAATAAEPDAGWSLLKRGEARQAVKAFARTATDAPDKGAPKVGYALASATSGDLRQGARAMRRALRVDADALHYLALDQDLERIINTVITDYGKADGDLPRQDAAFMRASLYYLLRDIENARLWLDRTDDRQSAANLARLIDEIDESS